MTPHWNDMLAQPTAELLTCYLEVRHCHATLEPSPAHASPLPSGAPGASDHNHVRKRDRVDSAGECPKVQHFNPASIGMVLPLICRLTPTGARLHCNSLHVWHEEGSAVR